MAKNRSEKSCYESKYDGGWITAPSMLAELACERIAGNNTLGIRFWQTDPWKKIFLREQALANRLLATPYSVKAILNAWNSPVGKRVKTLGAGFFKNEIEIEQRKVELELQRLETAVIPETVNILETPRPMKRAGQSIREKLDNGTSKKSTDR